METFIELLLAAQQDRELKNVYNKRKKRNRVQSALYGLLREAPTLWTSTTTKTITTTTETTPHHPPLQMGGEKRKRESM